MEEIEKIGIFNLYDRVKIKNTNITGNIVLIHNDKECEIEYDKQFRGRHSVELHSINELEKE